jgi:hypothetical protein
MWNQTYGGPATEDCFSAIETSDEGYAMVGQTYFFGVGENDIWLIKIDSSGNMIFNQTYGGERAESSRAVFQKSDGGYVIAGSTFSFGQGENDFWLIKTDENGVIPEFPSWPYALFLSVFLTTIAAIFKSNDYHVRTAKSIEEACKLAKVGFSYFTEIQGVQIFRKPK